jgi:hypothetical protein
MKLIKIIPIVYFITVITVLMSNAVIGGDAFSGKVENNKYYVWDAILKSNSYGEKIYKEVPQSVYYYSLGITYLCIFTMPFFIFFVIKNIILERKKMEHN